MIVIHLLEGGSHDYLHAMYLRPILTYLMDKGHAIKLITNMEQAKDCTVLTDCDFLTPEMVDVLKNNGCKIVGFNMVDSSHLSQSCRDHPEDIDLIFSLTGIQKTNVGKELVIDKEFNPTLEDRQFLPDDQWAQFDAMRRAGRLLSLPYVHWERQPDVERLSYDHRSPNVLVRGGAHFRRVVLALFLMRINRLDGNSGFPLGCYFQPHMAAQFRFCDTCGAEYLRRQRYPFRDQGQRVPECNSPAKWGNELDLEHPGEWNNRCPASFYWLAQKFMERHGAINTSQLEDSMNIAFTDPESHLKIVGKTLFTADLKWIHSIYAAQRFWDGAIGGAINLLPERTNDQDFFPVIEPDEHYVTFKEDFSDLAHEATITKDKYEHISAKAFDTYNEWIRPTDYAINTKLLQMITYRILS